MVAHNVSQTCYSMSGRAGRPRGKGLPLSGLCSERRRKHHCRGKLLRAYWEEQVYKSGIYAPALFAFMYRYALLGGVCIATLLGGLWK